MKRFLYLIIMVPLLALTGCNVHEWPEKPPMVPFHIDLKFDTAMGEQDYFHSRSSRSQAPTHDLRYVIRAYPVVGGTQEYEPAEEFIFTKTIQTFGQDYDYSVQLELPEGEYRLVVWADFVNPGSQEDKYYKRESFTGIVLQGKHTANTDYRDAFSGSHPLTLESTIVEGVEIQQIVIDMARPLAKYTFIATDLAEFIEREMERTGVYGTMSPEDFRLDDYRVMIYYPMYMPNTYNAFTDKAVNSSTGVQYQSQLTRLNDGEAAMGFDYVVINDDPDAKVTVRVGVFDKQGAQLILSPSFNIPLKRSVNTLVRGKFLVTESGGGISIDPSFNGDHNIVLP